MFDRSLEERIEELEKQSEEQTLTIHRLVQSKILTNKLIEMIQDFISAHEMLFDILIKAKIIDKRKYKEEYNKYLFYSKEARGTLKEIQRQWKEE